MFLTPGASRLDLPNPCRSSTISSVHDPESPTQRWNSITVTSCGSPSRWRCWTHGHLQKGPPTMGTPWPSFSLVSSGGTGGTEGPQKPFLFHTLSMGKRWRRRWSKALAQTLDAAHGPGFSYKIQLGLHPLEQGRSPWSRVGFKPLNGIYPGLRSGPVAEEGPDVGLFPFLFLFLLEIMTELMS